MDQVKNAYYNIWRKGKKRWEEKDMNDSWTTAEWETFEYLGPRGMDVSFLRAGSMEDDDCNVDSSRAGAREVVKANKKVKFETASVGHENENAAARAAIAGEMAAHTKMSNRRLILQFGSAEEKARVLKDVMVGLIGDSNAEIVIDDD